MEQAEDPILRANRLLDQTQKLIDQTQAVLSQVQSFQAALAQLRAELAAHCQQLHTLLGPARRPAPEPRPPSAFLEPPPHSFPWEVASEREPEGVAQLPAPPVHAPGRPERRAAVRRSGNLVSIVLRRELVKDKTSSGWVLDRSLGGLGLLVDEPAQTGEKLLVRPTTAAADTPWVPVEVRYCKALGSSWRLGCRFVGQPSWDQVRLFG